MPMPKTRMLKAQCGGQLAERPCDYTLRIARSYLNRAGPPLCPDQECSRYGEPLEAAYIAEQIAETERTYRADADYSEVRRDEVTLRSIQCCASCGDEYDAGATMERSTAIEAGRWVTSYRCPWCTGSNGSKRALSRGASAKVVDRNALVRN